MTGAVRRQGRDVLLLLAVLTLPHLLFLAVDNRPPNDHDVWYTSGVADSLTNWAMASSPWAHVRVIVDHFLFEGWHPQGAQTVLLAVLAVFGPSLFLFRATNLLFLWLLVGSTYASGRQLRDHRFGLLVAGLVGWLPAFLAYARKWEPMFHGAAFSVLALALALRCLRPDAARLRWPWIALGLALGARFYTHPTGLPDLSSTLGVTAAIALWAARREGRPLRPLVGRLAICGGITLALGAWYLGVVPRADGEPSYKLMGYLAWRSGYVSSELGWFDPVRNSQAALKLGRGLLLWHWQAVLLVVAIPGLIRLPGLVRRAPTSGIALLAGIAALQLPVAWVTVQNGGVVVDWLHLEPLFLVLCAASLATWERPRRWLFGVAVANVVFAAVVPPLASLTGPDPQLDDRAWTLRWLAPWAQLETGDAEETPHLLSSGVQAGDVVAQAMADAAGDARHGRRAVLEVRDLTLAEAGSKPGAAWCGEPGALAGDCCGFVDGPRGGVRDSFSSPWPFMFAGWSDVDRNAPGVDHRFVLVRLFHPQDGGGPLFEGMAWEPEGATPIRGCVEAAEQQVRDAWPGASVRRIDDPQGRLISRMWAYPTEYAHRAFLVDRREGALDMAPVWNRLIDPGGRPR